MTLTCKDIFCACLQTCLQHLRTVTQAHRPRREDTAGKTLPCCSPLPKHTETFRCRKKRCPVTSHLMLLIAACILYYSRPYSCEFPYLCSLHFSHRDVFFRLPLHYVRFKANLRAVFRSGISEFFPLVCLHLRPVMSLPYTALSWACTHRPVMGLPYTSLS